MGRNILDQHEASTPAMNLLWVWKNQPPVMQWWFALSGISIMAIYFVLLTWL